MRIALSPAFWRSDAPDPPEGCVPQFADRALACILAIRCAPSSRGVRFLINGPRSRLRSGDPKRPILERGASRDWLISRLHSGDPMRPILEWCFLGLGNHGMGCPGVGNPGAGSHGVGLFRTGESGPGVGSHGVVGLLKTGGSWSGGSWSGESRSGGSWGGASKANGQFGLENRTSLMILCWRQQDWHQNPKTKKTQAPNDFFGAKTWRHE